jgi:hypothetical protein
VQGVLQRPLFELKQSELVSAFDRYVVEHPEWGEQRPREAHGVLHVEGDAAWNRKRGNGVWGSC